MKIDHEERILRCLEGEILDRVPHMELGFNAYPSVKLTFYMDRLPVKLKNWVLKFRIFENIIQSSKEYLGLAKPTPKTIVRKVLWLDSLANNFLSFPTSLEFMDTFIPFLFRIPIRLGIDMVPTMGYPSSIVRGWIERTEERYFISEDWNLIDVDELGDIRVRAPVYDPERQMEKIIEAYHNDPIDDKVEYIGKLRKSVEGKLALAPLFNGIFESWHTIWGLSNMHHFFRAFHREYKKGPPYGRYKNFLREKSKFYTEFVKRLAEQEIKFVALVEDVCEDNGPFLKADQYRKFYVPEIKRIVDAAHKVGIKVLFHTDGKFKIENSEKPWEFLEAILSTGIDMLHGCQADCNNLEELKTYVGNKVTLVGGLSCVDILQHARSAKEIYLKVGQTLKTLKEGGHYIVAADNGWHTGVKMENIRWYLKAIRYYGRY
ncbi:MAG: uroporphyrinogen decarboxylase family protein [Candidatus Helarchaeota archaeon]